MNRFMQFASAVFTIALVLLILAQCLTAKADDLDVQRTADRVALVLILHGFDKVSTHDLPPVELMEHRNGNAGETPGRVIRVSGHEPEACRIRIVSHELCHIMIAKAYGARDDAEGVCRAVEEVIDPGFKPNCESKE